MRKILTVDEILRELYNSDMENDVMIDACYWIRTLKSENEQLKEAHSQYQVGLIFGTCIAALLGLLIKLN